MTQTINRNSTIIELNNQEVNKMELNQAIFYIITHNIPKKEMKEQVKLVKNAGYRIEKGGRHNWYVENPVTRKYVSADVGYSEITLYNNGRFAYKIDIHDCQYRTEYWERCHTDFVGIIDKPVNNDWLWVLDHKDIGTVRCWWRNTPTQQKCERLKTAKHYVGYRVRDIKETQKKIEELQKELIRLAGEKVKEEQRLNEVRKELGLRERR